MAHCRFYLLHCLPSSTREQPLARPGARHRQRVLVDGDTHLQVYVRRMITSSSARIIDTIPRFEDKYHQPPRGTPDSPVLGTLCQAPPGFLRILKRIPKAHPPCRPLLGPLALLVLPAPLRKDSVSDPIDGLSISPRIWSTASLYGKLGGYTTIMAKYKYTYLILKSFGSTSPVWEHNATRLNSKNESVWIPYNRHSFPPQYHHFVTGIRTKVT
jgi:hypothetical protein